MTTTITRRELHEALDGHALDTDALAADPRTAGSRLSRADRDHDGTISGDREIDALYDMLSRYDGAPPGGLHVEAHREGNAATAMVAAIAEHSGSEALAAYVRDVATPDAAILVGMTPAALAEAEAMRRHAPVHLISDAAGSTDGPPIATAEERGAWVASLGLEPEREAQMGALLEECEPGARGELVALATLFARAEHGAPMPSRLVLSGRGMGDDLALGGDDEVLRDDVVLRLGALFPEAASRVEHIELHIGDGEPTPFKRTVRLALEAAASFDGATVTASFPDED